MKQTKISREDQIKERILEMEEKIEGILLPENHKERKTSMIQYARFL
jgi:hypothetical protein